MELGAEFFISVRGGAAGACLEGEGFVLAECCLCGAEDTC